MNSSIYFGNIAIIIPAYKPNNTLIDLVSELSSHFRHIIVIDDGNDNNSKAVFDSISAFGNQSESGTLAVLHHEVNKGKGRALKTGFEYILSINNSSENRITGAITVDADGQHKIADILSIASMVSKNDDKLVLGCRQFDDKKIPLRSRFGNRMTKIVFKWCCGINISDTQTGLRGIPVKLLPLLCATDGERYEYETSMLIVARDEGIDIIETPIETVYEPGNPTSHFHPLKDSAIIYSVLLKYSISSLLAWIVDFTVFLICNKNGLSIFLSNYLGRGASCVVNFNVNKRVVFKNKEHSLVQFLKYISLVVISGTISAGLISLIQTKVPFSIGGIKIIVEVILYFANYYIQNNFIFNHKRSSSIEEKTDWTEYYKKKKSFFSEFTQKYTLKIINNAITELNNNESPIRILELGGGNSCFANQICLSNKVQQYDIIDNNVLAVEMFDNQNLSVEHKAYCINLLNIENSDCEKYDFVYSIGLIEHFRGDDIKKVIKQHFDRCSVGGTVLISFPTPTKKYLLVRSFMEKCGVWQFNDEKPIRFDEVKDNFEEYGEIQSHFLNKKLPLTQYVVIAKKISDEQIQ